MEEGACMIIDNFRWLSLVPPIMAVVLVLMTKESMLSLIIGAFVGCLIAVNFNPIKSIEMLFKVVSTQITSNVYIVLFLMLLGALIAVMTDSGGAAAYGNWINKRVKTKVGAQMMSVLFGVLFFIDDYFNCLTNGTIMLPVFEKQKISREKLAYITHSTSVPICLLIPMSSWVAVFLSTLDSCGMKNSFEIFIKTIPYNFYCILTIVMVLVIVLLKLDFGSMLKFEDKEQSETKNQRDDTQEQDENGQLQELHKHQHVRSGKGRDLIIPIIFLIIFSILSLLYGGSYFSEKITILDALKRADSSKALTYGVAFSLLVSFCMCVFSKRMNLKEFTNSVTEGVKSMVPAFLILILAWTIGGVCKEIGTGEYVKHMVETFHVSLAILPLLIFIFSGLLAFATGTAWGIYGILVPVVMGLAKGLDEKSLVIFTSAVLAGSILGSHASPISDTCILSSTGANCEYINHVSTQTPYIILVLGVACLDYIVINFVESLVLIYLLSILLIVALTYYFHRLSCRKLLKRVP